LEVIEAVQDQHPIVIVVAEINIPIAANMNSGGFSDIGEGFRRFILEEKIDEIQIPIEARDTSFLGVSNHKRQPIIKNYRYWVCKLFIAISETSDFLDESELAAQFQYSMIAIVADEHLPVHIKSDIARRIEVSAAFDCRTNISN